MRLYKLYQLKSWMSLMAILILLSTSLDAQDYPADYAKAPRFKALLYYSEVAEPAHIDFANDAIDFFTKLTYGEGFILDITTSLENFDFKTIAEYSIIIDINATPNSDKERKLFEEYLENGGGWLGFHGAGYNDVNTNWKWFNKFLGCGVFLCNNWPPQSALIEIENSDTDVTKNLPTSFVSAVSEWYQWDPSPRKNPDVEILASLSPKNYPLGIKDIVYFGDFPIAWRNKKYRMIYLNYGHGDTGFSDDTQNLLTLMHSVS